MQPFYDRQRIFASALDTLDTIKTYTVTFVKKLFPKFAKFKTYEIDDKVRLNINSSNASVKKLKSVFCNGVYRSEFGYPYSSSYSDYCIYLRYSGSLHYYHFQIDVNNIPYFYPEAYAYYYLKYDISGLKAFLYDRFDNLIYIASMTAETSKEYYWKELSAIVEINSSKYIEVFYDYVIDNGGKPVPVDIEGFDTDKVLGIEYNSERYFPTDISTQFTLNAGNEYKFGDIIHYQADTSYPRWVCVVAHTDDSTYNGFIRTDYPYFDFDYIEEDANGNISGYSNVSIVANYPENIKEFDRINSVYDVNVLNNVYKLDGFTYPTNSKKYEYYDSNFDLDAELHTIGNPVYYAPFYKFRHINSIFISDSVGYIDVEKTFYGAFYLGLDKYCDYRPMGTIGFDDCISITVDDNNSIFSSNNDNTLYSKDKSKIIYSAPKSNVISNLPNFVNSIGDFAFAYRQGVESLTIGRNIASIGYCAFIGNTKLKSLTINSNNINISNFAFLGCPIEFISINGNVEYHFGQYNYNNLPQDYFKTAKISNERKMCNDIRQITEDTLEHIVFGNTYQTDYVRNDICNSCSNLEIAEFYSISIIGRGAFLGCGSLYQTNYNESTYMDYSTLFRFDGSLRYNFSKYYYDGRVSLEPYAFYGCTSILENSDLNINDRIYLMENGCFGNLGNINKIIFGCGVVLGGSYLGQSYEFGNPFSMTHPDIISLNGSLFVYGYETSMYDDPTVFSYNWMNKDNLKNDLFDIITLICNEKPHSTFRRFFKGYRGDYWQLNVNRLFSVDSNGDGYTKLRNVYMGGLDSHKYVSTAYVDTGAFYNCDIVNFDTGNCDCALTFESYSLGSDNSKTITNFTLNSDIILEDSASILRRNITNLYVNSSVELEEYFIDKCNNVIIGTGCKKFVSDSTLTNDIVYSVNGNNLSYVNSQIKCLSARCFENRNYVVFNGTLVSRDTELEINAQFVNITLVGVKKIIINDAISVNISTRQESGYNDLKEIEIHFADELLLSEYGMSSLNYTPTQSGRGTHFSFSGVGSYGYNSIETIRLYGKCNNVGLHNIDTLVTLYADDVDFYNTSFMGCTNLTNINLGNPLGISGGLVNFTGSLNYVEPSTIYDTPYYNNASNWGEITIPLMEATHLQYYKKSYTDEHGVYHESVFALSSTGTYETVQYTGVTSDDIYVKNGEYRYMVDTRGCKVKYLIFEDFLIEFKCDYKYTLGRDYDRIIYRQFDDNDPTNFSTHDVYVKPSIMQDEYLVDLSTLNFNKYAPYSVRDVSYNIIDSNNYRFEQGITAFDLGFSVIKKPISACDFSIYSKCDYVVGDNKTKYIGDNIHPLSYTQSQTTMWFLFLDSINNGMGFYKLYSSFIDSDTLYIGDANLIKSQQTQNSLVINGALIYSKESTVNLPQVFAGDFHRYNTNLTTVNFTGNYIPNVFYGVTVYGSTSLGTEFDKNSITTVNANDVVYAGSSAFSGCNNITSINGIDDFVYIGSGFYSYSGNGSGISLSNFPQSAKYIGKEAFKNISGIGASYRSPTQYNSENTYNMGDLVVSGSNFYAISNINNNKNSPTVKSSHTMVDYNYYVPPWSNYLEGIFEIDLSNIKYMPDTPIVILKKGTAYDPSESCNFGDIRMFTNSGNRLMYYFPQAVPYASESLWYDVNMYIDWSGENLNGKIITPYPIKANFNIGNIFYNRKSIRDAIFTDHLTFDYTNNIVWVDDIEYEPGYEPSNS